MSLGRYVNLGNPVADHPLNRGLTLWAEPLTPGSGGQTLRDLIRPGNAGTLTNGPAWCPGVRADMPAINFDGTDDYVTFGDLGAANFSETSPFTVAAWVRCASAAPTAAMVVAAKITNGGNAPGWLWHVRGDVAGDPYELNYRGTSNTVGVRWTRPANADWQHCVATYDGAGTAAGTALYVNGILQTPTTTADAVPTGMSVSGPFQIGARNATISPFGGRLGGIRIYSRALSAGEAQVLYRESLAGYPNALRRWSRGVSASASAVGMVLARRGQRIMRSLLTR